MAYLFGILVNEEHVYSRFRDRGQLMNTAEFIEEIKTLKRFAGYYDRMLRPEKEPNKTLREQLNRLNTFEFATAYPFLLYAYDAIENNQLSSQDLVEGLKILEAYMVRRYLARDTVGYINRMFPTLAREIDLSDFLTSLRRALATKNYPTDERMRQALEANELYKGRDREKLILVLESINRYLSQGSGGYTVLDGKATLEHIMPQSPSADWQRALGSNWGQDYELQHTLGNLTLVTQEWNSAMSNAPYSKKKGLLARHALQLNKTYFEDGPRRWNAAAIKERGKYLTDLILRIWPAPDLVMKTKGSWGERPRTLIILDDSYEVKSWRDVVQYTAEAVAAYVPDFERKIVSQLPNWFSKNEMASASRQLSNGWWIYVNLSGQDARKIAERLIELSEIPEEKFELIW